MSSHLSRCLCYWLADTTETVTTVTFFFSISLFFSAPPISSSLSSSIGTMATMYLGYCLFLSVLFGLSFDNHFEHIVCTIPTSHTISLLTLSLPFAPVPPHRYPSPISFGSRFSIAEFYFLLWSSLCLVTTFTPTPPISSHLLRPPPRFFS